MKHDHKYLNHYVMMHEDLLERRSNIDDLGSLLEKTHKILPGELNVSHVLEKSPLHP